MATATKNQTGESTQDVVNRANAMLAQTKAEGSKPFAGSSYATPIVATDLNPQTSPDLPPAPVPENTNAVDSTNVTIAPTLTDAGMTYTDGQWNVSPKTDTTTDPNGNYTSIFQSYLNTLAAPPDTADIYSSERTRLGVDEKQRTYNKYAGQLNAIQSGREARILAAEKEGERQDVTKGMYNAQVARINRDAAIEALPVQAQLAAAQGDLQMAQETLNTMFQIKSQDALAQYQFKQNVAKSMFDFMNESEKRRLDQVMLQEERAYNEHKDILDLQKSIMFNAMQNGAPDGVISAIQKAGDPSSIFMAAGRYGEDPSLGLQRAKMAQDQAQFNAAQGLAWAKFKWDQEYALQQRAAEEDLSAKEISQAQYQTMMTAKATERDMNKSIDAIDRILTNILGMAATTGKMTGALSGVFESSAGSTGSVLGGPLGFIGGTAFGVTEAKQRQEDVSNDMGFIAANLTTDKLREIKNAGGFSGAISDKDIELMGAASDVLVQMWDKESMRFKGSPEKVNEALNTLKTTFNDKKDMMFFNPNIQEAYLGTASSELDALWSQPINFTPYVR